MAYRNPLTVLLAALGVGVFGALAPPPCRAQVSPEASARRVKPAEGLEATLWAAEPMVRNPTSLDIDSRGRVWIAEGLNYRLTRNKRLPRVEDADKIKILEDTDGDGTADKVTVFADRIFPVPMGLAVEEHRDKDGTYRGCRVFVGNSPDLLVLEDTDGDDRADKRYPLLTGFGGVDSDHGVHGMVLGLDGKLYFTHGDGCCSVQQDHSERQQNFDVRDRGGRHVWTDQLANTLRCNRDGTQFEILADRQRNNYETCLNAFGNGFTSDNDDDGNRGCRVIWVMDGGHYGYRTPGSPRHWGEDVPGNVPKLVGTGNGSPSGIMVYEGDLLPAEYLGTLFEAEAGTRQINAFPLTRHGSTFRTEAKVLLASDDPWFRPVDVAAAPDGSVLVADWYDAGVGGHAFRDQTTGRIYRVAPRGSKAKAPRYDFANVEGLIEALKSPVVAAQDAARRGLIARGHEGAEAVRNLYVASAQGKSPLLQARALWVWSAIEGDRAAETALKDDDPRIREQGVRILGRDVSENGRVEYANPEARQAPAALAHLDVLLPLAADPDAGVRRELILALRNLPTEKVGEALKTLARTWDGQDRWYLEALGLALEHREGGFLAQLFDGTLYGDLSLGEAGKAGPVALPPYFPVDRNEAYIATGTKDLPATALSKTLGLAWRIHRPESLPLLGRILPALATPELQQAADDVMVQLRDPQGATVLAGLALDTKDEVRKRQLLATLARKLDRDWRGARDDPKVILVIKAALEAPATRREAVAMMAATGDRRYIAQLSELARDRKTAEEIRIGAVEALGQFGRTEEGRAILSSLIDAAHGQGTSNAVAEAAARTLPAVRPDANERLLSIALSSEFPLGLRREAVRTYARREPEARHLIDLAREGKLPGELKTEATTVLNAHPDRRIRDEVAKVLPLPSTSGGRPLPPIAELLRRRGDAAHGREVFFRTGTNSCGGCHRVQGQGQWIGPDLSTIGTKYGKDELLRSILNPNAAIGYNFRPYAVALNDGRVVTGLPIEESADRLVLKTAEGQRVVVRTADIEDKKVSEISLMPEGLAQTMSDRDLVDLLAFLGALRQPVSIVGQYHAVGPLAEKSGTLALDPSARVDLTARLPGAAGSEVAWRRLDANAESLIDVTPTVGDDPTRAVYLYSPVVSPARQSARLVLDTRAPLRVWLNGKEIDLPKPHPDQPRAIDVELGPGTNDLLIRVPGGPEAQLVTTFVASEPLAFQAGEKVPPLSR